MKKSFLNILLLSVLSLTTLIGLPRGARAFGQITEPIVHERALRGQVIEETVVLLNSEKTDEEITLLGEGDIAKWVTFYAPENRAEPITSITVQKEGRADVMAIIAIPEDAPNNTYIGGIAASWLPKRFQSSEQDPTTARLGQKIVRDVTITVTGEEIIKLIPSITPQTYTVSSGLSLIINIRYHNEGNIALTPQFEIKITKDDGAIVHHAIMPYPEGEETVKPLSSKLIPFEWQTAGQTPGKYRADAKVLLNGTSVYEDAFTFIITQQAEVEGGAALGTNTRNIFTYLIPLVVAVAASIIIILLIFDRRTSKRSPKNGRRP